MAAPIVYLGLGANLNDPVEQLLRARQRIRRLPAVSQLHSSSLYLSSPVGYSDQDDFVNCVLRIHYSASPQTLLAATQAIEAEMGRVRDTNNKNAPRTIDIDILWFEDCEMNEHDLQLPHPRWRQRLFVLRPWHEVAHDVLKTTLDEAIIAGNFADQTIHALRIKAAV